MLLKFPSDFQFGSATAAFQVEGNGGKRNTDWDIFLKNNPQIVKPDEKGPQWWTRDKAEKDITSMQKLGLTIQRLGFEWGRIEPKNSVINYEAIKRYKEIIGHIIKLGMTPMVTLNHYVLPEWIADQGGWENNETISLFIRYVRLIISSFPEVTSWITLNEPNYLVDAAYLSQAYPPQKSSIVATLVVRQHMITAHKKAFETIKQLNSSSQVGVAFALRWYPPEDNNDPIECGYARIINYIDNYNFISAMRPADFIGCNYYTGYFLNLDVTNITKTKRAHGIHQTKLFGEMKKPDAYVTDFGWPIVPDFFLALLRDLYKTFGKPIIITENGLADHEDKYRSFYILTHLVALWKAIEEGIPIKQYIHWATIDNIEWLEGYRMHFGLLKLDPVTGKRTLHQSAHLLKDIAHSHAINTENLLRTYLKGEQREKARTIIDSLLRGELQSRVVNDDKV